MQDKRREEQTPESSPFESEEISTLPEDERREILSEIDRIASAAKIAVTPDTFTIPARYRGIRLPLLLNLAAALVLVGGVFGLFQLFQEEDELLRAGGGVTMTAESRLIREIRREGEQRLEAKDSEIASIRSQLEEARRERSAIRAGIETRVRELEEQLRAELEAEIEVERLRLIREGVGEEDIERLLRDYERRRLVELRAEVEAYRAELEREQEERVAVLAALELELARNLEEARRERNAILEDARRRETELRSGYEQRLARLSEPVALAQQQVAALERQRETEELVQQQIAGFYERIRSAIAGADYRGALEVIGRFREYLVTDGAPGLPLVEQRRATELHILDSLTRLIEPLAVTERTEDDAEDLLEAARRFEDITRLFAAAERAADAGDLDEADRLATAALARVPYDLEAHWMLRASAQGLADDDGMAARDENLEQLEARIGALEAELEAAQAQAAELTHREQALRGAEQELRAQLSAEREQQRRRVTELQEALSAAEAEAARVAALPVAGSDDDAVSAAELERLRRLEDEMGRARAAYERFRETEADVVAGGEDALALIEGKLHLDEFLSSAEVSGLFPGLAERIRRYDDGFQETGRRGAILDVMDIVYTLSGLGDDDARRAYLLQERNRAAEPELVEFLDELRYLVAES